MSKYIALQHKITKEIIDLPDEMLNCYPLTIYTDKVIGVYRNIDQVFKDYKVIKDKTRSDD
jgi:hypothetical protein